MNHARSVIAATLLTSMAAPASAAPGGPIGTLPNGDYACETPGDAAGPAGIAAPDANFSIATNSSYRADGKQGHYLLAGDRVTMTSGPRKGQQFHRKSRGFLRVVEGSKPGALRCVLGSANNR